MHRGLSDAGHSLYYQCAYGLHTHRPVHPFVHSPPGQIPLDWVGGVPLARAITSLLLLSPMVWMGSVVGTSYVDSPIPPPLVHSPQGHVPLNRVGPTFSLRTPPVLAITPPPGPLLLLPYILSTMQARAAALSTSFPGTRGASDSSYVMGVPSTAVGMVGGRFDLIPSLPSHN